MVDSRLGGVSLTGRRARGGQVRGLRRGVATVARVQDCARSPSSCASGNMTVRNNPGPSGPGSGTLTTQGKTRKTE